MQHSAKLRAVTYLSPRIPRAFSRQSSSMCSVHIDPGTGGSSAESASHHHDQSICRPGREHLNRQVTRYVFVVAHRLYFTARYVRTGRKAVPPLSKGDLE